MLSHKDSKKMWKDAHFSKNLPFFLYLIFVTAPLLKTHLGLPGQKPGRLHYSFFIPKT